MENDVEVVVCKKCGDALAVCTIDVCHTDKDWCDEVSQYVKEGYTLKYMILAC